MSPEKDKKKDKKAKAHAQVADEEAAPVPKKAKRKNVERVDKRAAVDDEIPRKVKRKRDESNAGAKAEAAAGDAEQAGEARKKRKRKKNKKGDAPAEKLDEAEERRRAHQLAVLKLVVKLRAEGKTKAEIDAAKHELKASSGIDPDQSSRKERQNAAWTEWQGSSDAYEQRKQMLAIEHDVVIIPVQWRGRHDSSLKIKKATDDIKELLMQQNVDAWVDARRQYTPGQKFAHWEFKGVMLRIEVGPEDLQAGVCRVCKAHVPGEYKTVEKKRIKLPPSGSRSLLLALKEWGLEKIEIDRRAGDSADEEEAADSAAAVAAAPKKRAAIADTPAAVPVADEDVEGNWAPRPSTAAAAAAREEKLQQKKRRKQR